MLGCALTSSAEISPSIIVRMTTPPSPSQSLDSTSKPPSEGLSPFAPQNKVGAFLRIASLRASLIAYRRSLDAVVSWLENTIVLKLGTAMAMSTEATIIASRSSTREKPWDVLFMTFIVRQTGCQTGAERTSGNQHMISGQLITATNLSHQSTGQGESDVFLASRQFGWRFAAKLF